MARPKRSTCLQEEGLANVFARHARHAEQPARGFRLGLRAAVASAPRARSRRDSEERQDYDAPVGRSFTYSMRGVALRMFDGAWMTHDHRSRPLAPASRRGSRVAMSHPCARRAGGEHRHPRPQRRRLSEKGGGEREVMTVEHRGADENADSINRPERHVWSLLPRARWPCAACLSVPAPHARLHSSPGKPPRRVASAAARGARTRGQSPSCSKVERFGEAYSRLVLACKGKILSAFASSICPSPQTLWAVLNFAARAPCR